MSEKESLKNLDDRDSQLMDALLQHALQAPTEDDERRISSVLNAIRQEKPLAELASSMEGRRSRLASWIAFPSAAAALLALALIIWPTGSRQQAIAAVERGLAAEEQAPSREYAIELTRQDELGNVRNFNLKLFVSGRDFVIRTQPLFGRGEVWLGGQGERRWIVPGQDSVVVGKSGILRHWIRRRRVVETPFLNVSSILSRMRRSYDLEMLPSETVAATGTNPTQVLCNRVMGSRQSTAPAWIPARVEVWLDREAGFARRVVLSQNRSAKEAGWLEMKLQLVAMPNLPKSFFDHDAHHRADRQVDEYPEEWRGDQGDE